MGKLFHVVITEIDPTTKAEKEVHIDELYENVTMLADCADRKAMNEVALNDNLIGIAAKILCGKKVSEAMKLAVAFDDKAENGLLRAIMGE